jgi:hypothetical protein
MKEKLILQASLIVMTLGAYLITILKERVAKKTTLATT